MPDWCEVESHTLLVDGRLDPKRLNTYTISVLIGINTSSGVGSFLNDFSDNICVFTVLLSYDCSRLYCT